MADSYITFGGTSSADLTYDLIIHKVPNLNRSTEKIDVFSVPGRDGDIILPQGAWENQIQEYDIYVGEDDAPAAASELAEWLFSLSGYQELTDSWETDVYRMAYLCDPLDIENIMGKVGHVTLRFSCIPKRYLVSGSTTTTITATSDITNPTAFTAKPLLKVTGTTSSTGTIACGDNTLSTTFPIKNLYIDCDTCQAYSAAGTYYNSYISGDFPEIPSGTQSFAITGDITKVVITPRWYRR